MNQTIEVNIADVLARLETKIDRLDSKIDKVSEDLQKTRLELTEKVNHVSNDVGKLDESIKGLGKRVENLEFIARTIAGGVIVALLLGLAKFLFPNFSV